jgi:hypothetical protein
MAKKQKKPLMADIKKNLDVVVLIVLLALSGAVVYLYLNEEKSGSRPIPPIPATTLDQVADIADHEGNVDRIFTPTTTTLTQNILYNDLIQFPLFKKMSSEEAQGAARVAGPRRRQALLMSGRLLTDGSQFEDAMSQADEVLSDDPASTEALALKDEITKKMEEAAANAGG